MGQAMHQNDDRNHDLSLVDIHQLDKFLLTESLSKDHWVSPDEIENTRGIIICCLRELGVHPEAEVTYKILMRRSAYAKQLVRNK